MRIRDYIRDGLAMGQKRDNKSGLYVSKIIRVQRDQPAIPETVRNLQHASRHTTYAKTQRRPARVTSSSFNFIS